VMASSLAMANSKSAAGVLVPQVMLSPSGLSTMATAGA
jgi:hypothetical protein